MSDHLQVRTDIDADSWDAYVTRHPDSTIQHLWRWREIFTGVFGHRVDYLGAFRGDALAGVLPLVKIQSRVFGRSVISLPFLDYGGLLVDDTAAADALLAE